MMGNLDLLDLEYILIAQKNFDIELNEKEMIVSSDLLWEELHNNKILEIDSFGDDMFFVRYLKKSEEQKMIICFDVDEIEKFYLGVA